MNEPEFDTKGTNEIVCPWCGHKFSDSWEYNDDGDSVIDCRECDQPIVLYVNVDVTYYTKKGCDGVEIQHDYKDHSTEADAYTYETCRNCGDVRRQKRELNSK